MTASFASPDWIMAFAEALEHSARVRTESTSWVFGPMLLIVDADTEHGFEGVALSLRIHEGTIDGMVRVDVAQAATHPFVIEGSFAHWKAVLGGRLAIVQGILDSKLRMKGDLPTLGRHRDLLDAIAEAGGAIDTAWQDEQVAEPVKA